MPQHPRYNQWPGRTRWLGASLTAGIERFVHRLGGSIRFLAQIVEHPRAVTTVTNDQTSVYLAAELPDARFGSGMQSDCRLQP